MALWKTHPREDLLRYLDGDVGEGEKRTLENHLATCEDCRRYLARVKDFNKGLDDLAVEEFTSDEPHPDTWTLVAHEAGKLDGETARNIRAHLLFCDECQEEFLALRGASQEEAWRELFERIQEFVIDLGKTYGPGALIGAIRIAAEQPAFASRGDQVLSSKVLEVPVGSNGYSIELTLTEAGFLSCDIATFRGSVQAPLQVSLRSETGEEIVSTDSGDLGKCNFVTLSPLRSGELYVLSLNLKGDEEHIPFRTTPQPA